MKTLYINFYFKNISYDDSYYSGEFHAPDNDVVCEFKYNRHTKEIDIWNNNKAIEDILPIPIWWLDKKIDENGKLKKYESRVCY